MEELASDSSQINFMNQTTDTFVLREERGRADDIDFPLSFVREQMKKDSPQILKRKRCSKNRTDVNVNKNQNHSLETIPNLSQHYSQLRVRFMQMKRKHALEKARLLNLIRQKTLKVSDMSQQRDRLEHQKNKMVQKIDQIRQKLQYVRQRNYRLRYTYDRSNSQYLDNVLLAIQYQGGLDINPDNMTYEELLQLGERIGNVSKGLTEEEVERIGRREYVKGEEADTCTICCEDMQPGESITQFNCKHIFHFTCIKDWLNNQKTCPICKQDVVPRNA